MGQMIRVHAIISGRVQGVCFRMETKRTADRYAVFGWVKNRPDGKVEAVFEGDKVNVDMVVKWCHKGPLLSKVESVEVALDDTPEGFNEFRITY